MMRMRQLILNQILNRNLINFMDLNNNRYKTNYLKNKNS